MAEARGGDRLPPFVALPLCKPLKLNRHAVRIVHANAIPRGSGRRTLRVAATRVHGLSRDGVLLPPLLALLQIVLSPQLKLGCDDWLVDELRKRVVSLPQRKAQKIDAETVMVDPEVMSTPLPGGKHTPRPRQRRRRRHIRLEGASERERGR